MIVTPPVHFSWQKLPFRIISASSLYSLISFLISAITVLEPRKKHELPTQTCTVSIEPPQHAYLNQNDYTVPFDPVNPVNLFKLKKTYKATILFKVL